MSSTVVVRRVAATPVRSAAEAWNVIAGLLAPSGSAARQELDRVAGIGASLIAAEGPRDAPIVVSGTGPQLRVYCLFDEAAILGEAVAEDLLPWCPTEGNWALSLPCPPEDLAWVQAALASLSSRVTARDATDPLAERSTAQAATEKVLGPVDVEAFLRP